MKKTIIYTMISTLLLTSCEKDESKRSIINYEINETESHVEWKGYLTEGNNYGTFTINNDDIVTENGQVTGGSFTIPVSTVNVLNLQGDLKTQLEHHLLSADFFDVALHPEVTFAIKEVTAYTSGNKEGIVDGANYNISGQLKMLGTTKEITFPAKITIDNDKLTAEALIRINRLDWGMAYASDPNAGQYILPDVDLHLKLASNRK